MRRSAFPLALAALLGLAGVAAAQDNQPAATEQTPIVVPGNELPPTEVAPADQPTPAVQEAPPVEQGSADRLEPPPDQTSADQQAPAGEPALINPNPLSSLSLDSLSATRTAPLFTASRTAPVVDAPVDETTVAAPVETAAPAEEPPPLELIGIVLTDSSQTALLRDSATNEVHRLSSGEELNDWELKIVDARTVEFHQGDRVHELKMFAAFPVSAAPSAPPEGGAPPEMDGQPQMSPVEGAQQRSQRQQVEGQQRPDYSQSSDIVQGAGDAQSSDIVRAPDDAQNQSGDMNLSPAGNNDAGGSGNGGTSQSQSENPDGAPLETPPETPPAETPPPADFEPPVGKAPVPPEDVLPPGPNSN